MALYEKTRLFEEPFTVHKALTTPHRIAQWISKQQVFQYTEDLGFFSSNSPNVYLKPLNSGTDHSIPFELTYSFICNHKSIQKKAPMELFYMKSHSQSDKYTDLHLYSDELDEQVLEVTKIFIKQFFETLRKHYNGTWIIEDRELKSSRLF